MTKYTKMLSRVVTISTYAIIFCVIGNMVMPALVIESVHAQAVTSSSTAQPTLSASDQKILDKAKADAKIAIYKDLKLTPQEIAFVASFDMEAISQKADKYVTPNKVGILSLDVNSFRKDGTVKLSKANTEIAILIINKEIAKYNSLVKGINTEVASTQKNMSASSIAVSNSSGVQVTKSVSGKTISINFNFDTSKIVNTNASSGKLQSASISLPGWPFCSWASIDVSVGWWGSYTFRLNDCAAKLYTSVYMVGVGALLGAGLAAIFPAYGVVLGVTVAISGAYARGIVDWMNSSCGNRGIYLRGNAFSPWNFPVPGRVC